MAVPIVCAAAPQHEDGNPGTLRLAKIRALLAVATLLNELCAAPPIPPRQALCNAILRRMNQPPFPLRSVPR